MTQQQINAILDFKGEPDGTLMVTPDDMIFADWEQAYGYCRLTSLDFRLITAWTYEPRLEDSSNPDTSPWI